MPTIDLSRRRRYLEDTVEALGYELEAAREEESAPVPVEGGRRLGSDATGATYSFTLMYESAVTEAARVWLEVGTRRWEAEVLQRQGLSLLLFVRRDREGALPNSSVASARVRADLSYLIEQLQAAVRGFASQPRLSAPAENLLARLLDQKASAEPAVTGAGQVGLNREQAEAVRQCRVSTVWFVWGPPGTGKTKTLGHVVVDAAAGGSVLVTAHSNVAVDAALAAAIDAGLVKLKNRVVVRAGPAVLGPAKDAHLSTRDIALARDPALKGRLAELTRKLSAPGRSVMATVLKQWRDAMEKLRAAEDSVLRGADVVFATLSKVVIDPAVAGRSFDVACVDEVSMTYPAQVLVAAAKARQHLNVFGDCRQLPPIVQSGHELAKKYLSQDVFSACRADRPDAPGVTMLKEQFRMHPDIRKLVSEFAYGGLLRDAPGLESARAPIAAAPPGVGKAIVWYDITYLGAYGFQVARSRSWSRFNPVSALCTLHVALEARSSVDDVVLLTPYAAQAKLLAALVRDAGVSGISVGTVHRYQGSEAPVVVVDLVDTSGRVGKLFKDNAGQRLLTVAFSRAQGKLIVVSDSWRKLTALTVSSAKALQAVQRERVVPLLPWADAGLDHFALRTAASLSEALEGFHADKVVASWLPNPLAEELLVLNGPYSRDWEQGHAGWATGDGSVGLHVVGPGVGFSAVLTNAPRFAETLAEAVTGVPLSRRAAANAPEGAKATVPRHDQCARCDGRVAPYSETPLSIELRCGRCGATRKATDQEIQSWLFEVGPRCPACGQALKLRAGPYGRFVSCSTFPKCSGRVQLGVLGEAALHPDPPPKTQRALVRIGTPSARPTSPAPRPEVHPPVVGPRPEGEVAVGRTVGLRYRTRSSGAVVPLTSGEIIELAASIGLSVPTSAGADPLGGGMPVRQLSSFPAAAVRQAFRQLRSGHSSWDEWLERAKKLARGTTAATPSPGRKTTPSVSQEADGSGRSLSFGDAAVAVVGMPVKRYAGLSRRGWQVIGLSQLVCSECDDRLGVIQHTVSGAVALLCAHDKESWPLDEKYSSATRRHVEEFVRSQLKDGAR